MYVPRWVLLSVMVAVATVAGWMLRDALPDSFGATQISASMDDSRPAGTQTGTPANIAVDGGNSSPVVNLVIDGSGQDDAAAGADGSSGGTQSDEHSASTVAYRSGTVRRGSSTVSGSVAAVGSGPRIVYVNGAGGNGGETVVNHQETLVSNDSRITVNGNEIVVASDGSIVFQGDNGSLNGNTGDSSSSGSIAIDNNGSTVSTGTSSGHSAVSAPPGNDEDPDGLEAATQDVTAQNAAMRAADLSTEGELASARSTASTGQPMHSSAATKVSAQRSMSKVASGAATDSAATDAAMAAPMGSSGSQRQSLDAPIAAFAAFDEADVEPTEVSPTSPLWGWSLHGASGRAVSISGYEDHSITVDGNDQIILYDDSNVFIDRDGQVNANTGDTDSSGLNVVDAVDSIVRSGNSGDGEGSGDDEEEEDEDEDTAPVAGLGAGAARTAATFGATKVAGAQLTRTSASPASERASGSVDDEDTTTSASGDDALIIGGDGYDDLAVRSRGNRNIVVYDDSNLVLGGTGGVNAQIGDSDTGGAVVMGVRNSVIEAGCEGDLCPLYQR